MNILTDSWLPVIRKDGSLEKIAFWQITEKFVENPVVDIVAPRPDFHNALYQLLIGILHLTALAPNEYEWCRLWQKPYSPNRLLDLFLSYNICFKIDTDGPAFMQDYELKEADEKAISTLLIEAPGENTLLKNLDHFIKRDYVEKVDGYWAATALYTMQTLAPAGGAGHRTSLRGGGPLTSLLLPVPQKGEASLWQKVWLNVCHANEVENLSGNIKCKEVADKLPWMKPTKVSKGKGTALMPKECHPFHMFFGMPRRMRLSFSNKSGICDLTGEPSENLVSSFRTAPYGNNYVGAWEHPLTSYSYISQKDGLLPIANKVQSDGLLYRHWLGLIKKFETSVPEMVTESMDIAVWSGGYDMDNMKARCWYESVMPRYNLDEDKQALVEEAVEALVESATDCVTNLKKSIRAAWFSFGKEVKGDVSFVEASFWQETELTFYTLLGELVESYNSSSIIREWAIFLEKTSLALFDTLVLRQQEGGRNMRRIIKAHMALKKGLRRIVKKLKSHEEEV